MGSRTGREELRHGGGGVRMWGMESEEMGKCE